jgi:hypothetical protein
MFNRPIVAFLSTLGLLCVAFIPAQALAANAPGWNITAEALPTNFTPNGTGIPAADGINGTSGNTVRWTIRNLGDTPISGEVTPIVLAVSLAGVSSAGISGSECQQPAGPCTFRGVLEPGQSIGASVLVNAGAPGTGTSTATVTGGEAGGQLVASATVNQSLTINSSPAPFGLEPSSLLAEFVNNEGGPETQAGAHPYNLSVSFRFSTRPQHRETGWKLIPTADVKDVAVEFPPGVVADQLALAQCTTAVLEENKCSGASQLGTIHPTIANIGLGTYAIFNLKPDNGHTNEIGFNIAGVLSQHMPSSVRTGSDYGITTVAPDIANSAGAFISAELQVWGVPADPSHGGSPLPPTAFWTMPTQCGKPLVFKVAVDSRVAPGRLLPDGSPDLTDGNWKTYSVAQPGMSGCERLQLFAPDVTVAPATTFADTPAGTTVEVSVPQGEGLTNPGTLATSTLQNTKVTLPAGLVINPGQANGLSACQFSEDGVGTTGPPSCPGASKVGTVEIESPLLPDKLVGSVYVLQSNPPDLQLLVGVSADGVNVKLVGHVHLDSATGQLTSTFDGTPQLPFTHFRLTFSGGAQAALSTPASCGVYATTADFTPWSSPFTPDFISADGFALTSGPGGTPCASPLPFSPTLTAGATTDQAGGFTDFSLLLQRGDGQQRVAALQFKTPKGLLGMLSKVPLCGEAQAAAGTCSAASQIGHTIVGAGAGPAPLYVPEPGQAPAPIYLTGPYKGAPFGLSIVVPVIAGPFNLGTVVVRAAISVDRASAQLTISTDALPLILAGIPTDLRQIDAVIDRPGFMFNPTNCAPQALSGTAQSAEGASAAISSRFQIGSCQSLLFKPDFKVSTQGKTSKANGASLDARVVYPPAPTTGNQASQQSNIATVRVELPRQLPSRLTTLQKACLASVFEANPANCPAASRIGVAKAITPVLPVPLTGPVFFVSHGGEAFPSLVAVLQGDGVRVDLLAETFISKAGITSSTFRQVPDVPISSFELYLPEGRYSALAATANLCKTKLAMPTTFTAQDGAVIHQSTPIAVTGCPKAKKATKKKAKKARKAGNATRRATGRTSHGGSS